MTRPAAEQGYGRSKLHNNLQSRPPVCKNFHTAGYDNPCSGSVHGNLSFTRHRRRSALSAFREEPPCFSAGCHWGKKNYPYLSEKLR